MPALTRRRNPERQDCWHVDYGDVHVGTIARSIGNPNAAPQWQWRCGFYPGCDPGQHRSGTSATLDEARADFAAVWAILQPTRTETDFDAWRCQRARTAWKYAMWDAGMKMPTQTVDGRTRCFCGAAIDDRTTSDHIHACHMEVA